MFAMDNEIDVNNSPASCYITDEEDGDKDGEDDDDDDSNKSKTKRVRGDNIAYYSEKCFASLNEAKSYLKQQHQWNYKSKSSSSEGVRLLYLCKYSNICAARRSIWMPKNCSDQSYHVQSNMKDHTHKERRLIGIPYNVKNEINSMWKNGIRKPRMIEKQLRLANLQLPKITQLNNYLITLRRSERKSEKVDELSSQ